MIYYLYLGYVDNAEFQVRYSEEDKFFDAILVSKVSQKVAITSIENLIKRSSIPDYVLSENFYMLLSYWRHLEFNNLMPSSLTKNSMYLKYKLLGKSIFEFIHDYPKVVIEVMKCMS